MKQADYATWFARSNGNWTSSRRYLFGRKRTADTYDTKFTVNANGNSVSISWDGDMSAGDMNMTIDGDILKRDRGYFTSEATDSKLTMVDDDTVVLETSYDGTTYREEIRLLFEDTVRLRQTIASMDGDITLVGQYFEEKVSGIN